MILKGLRNAGKPG
jgi:hypothetical protein